MIEPILSLAFSVHSNPGVYALLIGSGVSRSAQIPTGWEVVLDLIRKLAHLKNEDCEPDPEKWYQDRYGEEPNYSKILDEIAPSQSERNQLLRSYFEPSPEEKEQGIKVPTTAHRAIAQLVAQGYIRVIITTNFDRLIETALKEIEIEPTVISTPDSINGALPLAHSSCTVIKVHGDYLDTRIKNTQSELEEYDENTNRLLDQVFDEYGLIICGWSGDWDLALREAIKRCESRRFTTYWTGRRELKGTAKELLTWRKGIFIKIQDADSFFQELKEKVLSLQEFNKSHPLSVKATVETVKRYIAEERHKIRLHDLVTEEVNNVYNELSSDKFSFNGSVREEDIIRRVHDYEALIEKILSIIITGCYWGTEFHQYLWLNALEKITSTFSSYSGPYQPIWRNLSLYPALLLFYGGSLASIISKQYYTLAMLLAKPKVIDIEFDNDERSLALLLTPSRVMELRVGQKLPDMEKSITPVSDHLYSFLKDFFDNFLPNDHQYDRYFDCLELLLGLVQMDWGERYGDSGRLIWKWKRHKRELGETEEFQEIIDSLINNYGFFNSSIERYQTIYQEHMKRIQ